MNTQKTLADIQVGDELIQTGYGYSRSNRVVTVTRLTATQIIVGTDRFNRETGYAPKSAGGYLRTRVYPPSEGEANKVRDAYEREQLFGKLRHSVKWDSLPLQAMREINAILKQHNQ
jgi:hypothetical protein